MSLNIKPTWPTYCFNLIKWFLLSAEFSKTGGIWSNSVVFCTGDWVNAVSSWSPRGVSGMQGSMGTTPIASQSRWESNGGDGGLLISSSRGKCLWNLRSVMFFSWWLTSVGLPAIVQVSGTGREAAKRILNSWSNESTTGPFRTVIICRCRWASVHVRLRGATTCYTVCPSKRPILLCYTTIWIVYL